VSRGQHALVDSQFGPQANAYVSSAVHAQGEDLDALEKLAQRLKPQRALDLGTGGGHVAYRMAPHVGEVVAADLTAGMLAAVAEAAKQKGLANITTAQGPAERLPFADAEFDFVCTRFSAHHWHDVNAGLREARRVLKPGGHALIIDAVSPGPPLLDTHLQTIEALRDPSHVRDYSASEWFAIIDRAGFRTHASRTHKIRIDFATWIARMRTPEPVAATIHAFLQAAPDEVRTYFEIGADSSFDLDVLSVEASAS
jgi:ubiquinone/menaquinone biosynthesis C-methylase UbiE